MEAFEEIIEIRKRDYIDPNAKSIISGRIIAQEITVSQNGKRLYEQYKGIDLVNGGRVKTFVDEFLERFNAVPATDKTPNHAGYVVGDGGDCFYLISNRRLQSLNLKQKFLHFLLKHLFLHGKAATVENVKCLLVDNQ